MKSLLLLLSVAMPAGLVAQMPDHAWLEANRIRARINADGRLFCDDHAGAFFVSKDDTMITLVRAVGLWLGGLDPAGNLLISGQMRAPDSSDFTAGFRDIPNSGKVWKITRAEIAAHLEDYLEDGVVDHPIPAIFGWPGKGNLFFEEYNGFRLPDSMAFAGFEEPDTDFFNGNYEPNKGEYPRLFPGINSVDNAWAIPDELTFFAFHTIGPQNLIKGDSFPVQVWGEAYAYSCPDNIVLDNAVFVTYRWRYEGDYRVDSVIAAVYADADLGNPKDDYHGYLPEKKLYFVYNADTLDEGSWEQDLPVFFIRTLFEPIDSDGYPVRFHLMPPGYDYSSYQLPAASPPVLPIEYFNYLSGHWRDNSPLQSKGIGYNTGGVEIEGAFPGLPDEPGIWTERNAQNPPGDRSALLRYYLKSVRPKAINTMTHIFAFSPPNRYTVSQNINNWLYEFYKVGNQFSCCVDFVTPTPLPLCYYRFEHAEPPPAFAVYPNPASDMLKVWHKGIRLKSLRLYNLSGITMAVGSHKGFISEVPVKGLPADVYFLEIIDETGYRTVKKVVVNH